MSAASRDRAPPPAAPAAKARRDAGERGMRQPLRGPSRRLVEDAPREGHGEGGMVIKAGVALAHPELVDLHAEAAPSSGAYECCKRRARSGEPGSSFVFSTTCVSARTSPRSRRGARRTGAKRRRPSSLVPLASVVDASLKRLGVLPSAPSSSPSKRAQPVALLLLRRRGGGSAHPCSGCRAGEKPRPGDLERTKARGGDGGCVSACDETSLPLAENLARRCAVCSCVEFITKVLRGRPAARV